MDQIQTPDASAPASAAEPTAPIVEKTLQQFRAEKAAAATVDPEPSPAPAPTLQADAEPPEPPDEGEGGLPPAAQAKPPEQTKEHRWKDPDTGVTLDMRRRDHRRIRRLLEERADFANRLRQPAPQPQQPAPQRVAQQPQGPDPRDPEPSIEQFPLENYAQHPDPYQAQQVALTAAVSRWHAKQEFKEQQAQQTRTQRQQAFTTRLNQAQQDFDSKLPEIRTQHPDFDEAHDAVFASLARVAMPARGPIVLRLLSSPVRHDLTHYLGTHPDDLAAVASARTPHEQGMVLGAIETRVRALVNQRSKPVPVTNPPAAPMAPVNGGGTPTSYNPATASLAQFRRKHGVRGGRAVSA